ncbi:unnamed protein product [Camellia sinensis]
MCHAVWLNLQNINWWQEEYRKALPDWLQTNMKSPSKMAGLSWATIFLTTIWYIWKDRNKEVFEHHTQHTSLVTTQIFQHAKQIQEAFLNPLHSTYSEPKLTHWLAPIAGNPKLNSDGCSKGDPGQSGYGGLLRDETGAWLWGYHGYLGNCTSLEAELWGIYRGLTIIMQKGLANIVIETDSQLAMKFIQEGADRSSPYRALIEDTTFLVRRCNCTIQYTPREANVCADALANLGVNKTEHLVFLDEPPSSIFSFLIADMISAVSKGD